MAEPWASESHHPPGRRARRPRVRPNATFVRHAAWSQRALPLVPCVAIVLVGVILPRMIAFDATTQHLSGRLAPPVWMDGTWSHPLGTDGLGRDLVARLVTGLGRSLEVAFAAVIVAMLIGVIAGLASAFGARWIDATLTVGSEVILALPVVLVGIVVTAVLGTTTGNVVAIMVFAGWIGFARVIRLEAKRLRFSGFVIASQAFGAGGLHVVLRHIVPNLMSTIATMTCQQFAAIILWEASLTFLGLGLPIEHVSLGGMIRDGQAQVFNAWWVSVFPGLVIAATVASASVLNDWLVNRMDVHRMHSIAATGWNRGARRTYNVRNEETRNETS